LTTQENTYVAKTFAGLEPVLMKELEALGGTDVQLLRRAVSFKGDKQLLYRANIWCRTALSILHHQTEFNFSTKDDFYEQLREFDWSGLFGPDKTISIRAAAHNTEIFNNTLFLAQLSKDAIADHFRDKTGRRPDVDVSNAQVRITINVNKDNCMVALDSSGEALFKRGYRKASGPAPINEVLAAGLIMLSEWDGQRTFLDPMCGSGTFSIEAAMINANMAPGAERKTFGFSYWNDFDPELFAEEKAAALDQRKPVSARIIASDNKGFMLDIARQNTMHAGLMGSITVQRNDFFSYRPPANPGWVLLNPPYGQRMKYNDIRVMHTDIGDTLKKRFSGYCAGIISPEMDAMKHLGLKPKRKVPVFNGPLPCTFNIYELFEGKRKEFVAKRKRL